jgi:hypothetical protein
LCKHRKGVRLFIYCCIIKFTYWFWENHQQSIQNYWLVWLLLCFCSDRVRL